MYDRTMNGISMVISKPVCPVYNLCGSNKIKFGKSNKTDLIPHRLSNLHLQRNSPRVATTRVLKHRVYAVKSDATSSRSQVPNVSGAVILYDLFGVGILGVALGMAIGILKPNDRLYILAGAVAVAVSLAKGFSRKAMCGGLLLQDEPFSVGDIIEVGYLKGKVMEIGVMTTSVLTAENRHIEVPTCWFYGQVIMNKTKGVKVVPENRDFRYYI